MDRKTLLKNAGANIPYAEKILLAMGSYTLSVAGLEDAVIAKALETGWVPPAGVDIDKVAPKLDGTSWAVSNFVVGASGDLSR